MIVNGIVHLLVPLKLVIMKGGRLPNISLLYDHITRSPVYDYTGILVKSLLYSSKCIHYCEYAACCVTGFDFWQRQVFYPSGSCPDRTSSTAYHVVTKSVNIYVTCMWSTTCIRRKALGNFNTCSLSWKMPNVRKFVKNFPLVKIWNLTRNSALYWACAFCSNDISGCTEGSSERLEGSGLRAEYYYCYPRQMAVLYSLLRTVAEFSVPDR